MDFFFQYQIDHDKIYDNFNYDGANHFVLY
jgi:hypothetical protein